MTLDIFIRKWTHPKYPPEMISCEELLRAKRRFGFYYPADYKTAVEQFGLPHLTIALLEAIVERGIDLDCVMEFLNPEEAVTATLAWRKVGLPRNLVAFASDPSGHLFCFDADELHSESTASSTVWYYDHDFNIARTVAPSFLVWIEAFCGIEPMPSQA